MSYHLQRAVDYFGSQEKLAAAITEQRKKLTGETVTQQNISSWFTAQQGVPAHYCRSIEAVTERTVLRSDLRPDVFETPATI